MAGHLDPKSSRVELRCRACGGLSATIHATPEWGPALVTYTPSPPADRAWLDAEGIAGRPPIEDVHFLDHPEMSQTTGDVEIVCGRGRHGRLAFDAEALRSLYQRAGQRGPTRAVLDPIDG